MAKNLSEAEIYQAVLAIAKEFTVFECKQCADAIRRWLRQNGITGVYLKLEPAMPGRFQFMVSQRWKDGREAVSQNGVHYGIEVKEFVFDNLSTTEGLSRDNWIEDFDCAMGDLKLSELETF